jgi:hypothetical protein
MELSFDSPLSFGSLGCDLDFHSLVKHDVDKRLCILLRRTLPGGTGMQSLLLRRDNAGESEDDHSDSTLCGLDEELWDIKAKRANIPLYELLDSTNRRMLSAGPATPLGSFSRSLTGRAPPYSPLRWMARPRLSMSLRRARSLSEHSIVPGHTSASHEKARRRRPKHF